MYSLFFLLIFVFGFEFIKFFKGVVKHIGDILKENIPRARTNVIVIGIAPWGVVNEKESLIGYGVSLGSKFLFNFLTYKIL